MKSSCEAPCCRKTNGPGLGFTGGDWISSSSSHSGRRTHLVQRPHQHADVHGQVDLPPGAVVGRRSQTCGDSVSFTDVTGCVIRVHVFHSCQRKKLLFYRTPLHKHDGASEVPEESGLFHLNTPAAGRPGRTVCSLNRPPAPGGFCRLCRPDLSPARTHNHKNPGFSEGINYPAKKESLRPD